MDELLNPGPSGSGSNDSARDPRAELFGSRVAGASSGSESRRTGSWIDPDRLSVVVAFVTLVLIPVRLLSLGYLPVDDALRHAGKALTTRSWADILVLRPEIAIDSHPGWHVLLRQIHLTTGASAVDLVFISVTALFVLVCGVGLWSSRYALAWLSALAIAATFDQGFLFRFLMGRPFLVSVSALLAILCLGERGRLLPTRRAVVLWILGFGLVAWIHPSFYLFGLLVAALAISGKRRQAAFVGSVAFIGSLVAAIFSGQPLDFYEQAFLHPLFSLARPTSSLVAEFQPSDGSPLFALAAAGLLAAIWPAERRSMKHLLSDPVVILAGLGWVLARVNLRFWSDWGEPAALFLLSREIGAHVERVLPSPRARLGATTLVACVLGLTLCHDGGGRLSRPDLTYVPLLHPAMAATLPDPGGVLYSDDMQVFYNVFMRLPNAPFKFVLGFEVGWMKAEDEEVYRTARRFGSATAFDPWVKKMRPQDRLILAGGAQAVFTQLDWTKASAHLWSGRTKPGGVAEASAEKIPPDTR